VLAYHLRAQQVKFYPIIPPEGTSWGRDVNSITQDACHDTDASMIFQFHHLPVGS
jgi:hypothetical protein